MQNIESVFPYGLENKGSRCYLNTLLQGLLSSSMLVRNLYNPNAMMMKKGLSEIEKGIRDLIFEMHKPSDNHEAFCSPENIYHILIETSRGKLNENKEEDIGEALDIMVGEIEDEKTGAYNIINNYIRDLFINISNYYYLFNLL